MRFTHTLGLKQLCALLLVCAFSMQLHAAPTTLLQSKNAQQPEPSVQDPFERQSPASSIKALIRALSTSNPEDLDPYVVQSKNLEQLESDLKKLFDRSVSLKPDVELSKASEGDLKDALPTDLDQVGVLRLSDGSTKPVYMQRRSVEGVSVWQLDPELVDNLSNYLEDTNPTRITSWLGDSFMELEYFGVSVGQLSVALLAGLVALMCGGLIGYGLVFTTKKLWSRNLFHFALGKSEIWPVGVFIAAELYRYLLEYLGVSVEIRGPLTNFADLVQWLSVAWLLLRLIDGAAQRATDLTLREGHPSGVSAISLVKRVAKLAVLIIAFMVILSNLGFDLTTGIAALGIGGLALALGAQRTVENFVGSVVVVADRPINVGDFCRFGTTTGTVEDIGIRSTRIRTLERTLVTIPNGDFSSMEIENYSVKDRFWFHHELPFALNTKVSDIKDFMQRLRELLDSQSFLYRAENRVRLRRLERDCLIVEVFAYVVTHDMNEFLELQESLLMSMFELIEAANVDLSLPTQRMRLDSAKPLTEAASAALVSGTAKPESN